MMDDAVNSTIAAAAERAEINQIVGNNAAMSATIYEALANSDTGRALEAMGKLLDEWKSRPTQNPQTFLDKGESI